METTDGVQTYYATGGEQARLDSGAGRLEALRTTELLGRWLPPAPATVVDVGGAAGRYAVPLAASGYEVHLVDPVPLHVEQARAASRAVPSPLVSVVLGDARELPFDDASADAVLLLGPLYHLPSPADRARALAEAYRVLRPGGVVVAAVISRFGSLADGVVRGLLADPRFAAIVEHAVRTGEHRNDERVPGWFTTAYFHRPDEIVDEVRSAGLVPDGPVAVEGVGAYSGDLDALLDDPGARDRVLAALRLVERESSLLGASPHLLVAGARPLDG